MVSKRYSSPWLLFLVFLLAGCGSSDSYVTTPNTPQANVASVRVQSILAKTIVPVAVDVMRFTGLDSQGRTVYGPVSKAKAADILLENVPLSVTRLQIEYLTKGRLLGIGTTALNLQNGQEFVVDRPEFTELVSSLAAITLSPAEATVARGLSQAFLATGRFEDGTEIDISSLVNWTSSQSEVASITDAGVATGLRSGQSTILASLEGITGTAQLTVSTASLVSLEISPSNPSIPSGAIATLTALARLSDGSTSSADSVSWSSAAPSVATVDPQTGVLTSVSPGQAVITARSGAITATTNVTVTEATLARLTVTPATADVVAGSSQQFTATGTYSDGGQRDLTSTVRWASSDTNALPITAGGLASGQTAATGIAITAALGGLEGRASVNVTPAAPPASAVVVSIDVTPNNPGVATGGSKQLSATATLSNGTTQDVTSAVVWSSASPLVATVNSAGLVQGLTVGSSVITATSSNGVSGQETVAVDSTVLALQSFEDVPATPEWTYTGAPLLTTGNSGVNASPALSPLAADGIQAWQLESVSAGLTLQFANLALPTGAARVRLRFRLAAMNLVSTGGGPDNLDYVRVSLSTDGGASFYNRLQISGAVTDNSVWPYSATGLASLNYLPTTVQVFQPSTSGEQTTEGYSTGEILLENPVPAQLAIRITMRSSSSTDSWLLDDVRLTAEY